jgi:hypothetical protein
MRQADLAGAAHLELVSGVVQLRPEEAMFEAMLRGWRAQQVARGLRMDTVEPRERLVRRFASSPTTIRGRGRWAGWMSGRFI